MKEVSLLGFVIGILFGSLIGMHAFSLLNNGKTKKRRAFSRVESESFSSYMYSNDDHDGLTSESIISHIEHLHDRDGTVVIDIIDNELRISTLNTMEYDFENRKLEEIKRIIKEKI